MLGVDGKAIFVAGEERTLLVGVDQSSHDIVNATVLDTETEEGFERLVREAVTVAGYPLRGLVIDAAPPSWPPTSTSSLACRCSCIGSTPPGDWTLISPKQRALPTPHGAPNSRIGLGGRCSPPTPPLPAVTWLPSLRTALGSKVLAAATRSAPWSDDSSATRPTTTLPEMPADTNVTENVIKQLGKKLRLMESFVSMESAERFSRLLVGYYRFKRFTGSGRSPLPPSTTATATSDGTPLVIGLGSCCRFRGESHEVEGIGEHREALQLVESERRGVVELGVEEQCTSPLGAGKASRSPDE